MFNSLLIPMVSASERLAPRFFENHAKVNAAFEASSREMALVPWLLGIAIVVIAVLYVSSKYDSTAKEERHRDKERILETRALQAEMKATQRMEELTAARHLVAILRTGSYVPSDEVPPETPNPDSVFGAKPVPQKGAEAEATADEGGSEDDATGGIHPDAEGHDDLIEPSEPSSAREITDEDIEAMMAEELENDLRPKKN